MPADAYFSHSDPAPGKRRPSDEFFSRPGPAIDPSADEWERAYAIEWERMWHDMYLAWPRQAGKSTIAAAVNTGREHRMPPLLVGMRTKARARVGAAATARTIYYRGSDCHRVAVLDGRGREIEQVATITVGGVEGRAEAQIAAENAADDWGVSTSWIDVP